MHYLALKTLSVGAFESTMTQVADKKSCNILLSFLKKGINQKIGMKKENNKVKFLKIIEKREGLFKV